MTSRAQARMDRILGEAADKCTTILHEEARKLIKRRPRRYTRFVFAVGWGPTLFGPDGGIVAHHEACALGRKFLELADHLYERGGADNSEVRA